MDRKRRALFLVVAGLATLALTTWMSWHGRAVKQAEPDCAGCTIPWDGMIRFEIATSREQVTGVLGSAEEPCGRCIRKFFDAQNHIDLGFMVAYSALNAAVALFLFPAVSAGRRSRILFRIALVAAGAMLVGDFLETLALFHLTGPAPAFGPALAVLLPATRIKWLALAVAGLALAGLYLDHPRGPSVFLRLLAYPYLVAGILGLVAVVTGDTTWYARHITWLAYAWVLSLLHAALWLAWSLVRRRGAVERR